MITVARNITSFMDRRHRTQCRATQAQRDSAGLTISVVSNSV